MAVELLGAQLHCVGQDCVSLVSFRQSVCLICRQLACFGWFCYDGSVLCSLASERRGADGIDARA
jgi:hypothetical protein